MTWKNNKSHTTASQRRRIRKRDNNTCQHCGGVGTEVDHITNLKAGGRNDDDNLQLLCRTCHNKKTQQEAAAAQSRRYARRRLPKSPHPGYIN